MNRRDTIVVAVILNVALLALLFALAGSDEESGEGRQLLAAAREEQSAKEAAPPQAMVSFAEGGDEVDLVLGDLSAVLAPYQRGGGEETRAKPPPTDAGYIEVTVKQGDALEKIARNYNSSAEAIRHCNHLIDDKLRIGQLLRIPRTGKGEEGVQTVKEKEEPPRSTYIVKSGDSPWKIARHLHVSVDELLRANNLDEERARNLRVGQQLRVPQ